MTSLISIALAFPILAAAAAPVGDTCGYYDSESAGPYGSDTGQCYDEEGWTDLAPVGSKIPVDGVLVLQGSYQNGAPSSADIAVEVTLAGEPVAGALEIPDFPGVVVWRPAAAFTPGNYELAGTVTNPAGGVCVPAQVAIGGAFEVVAEPGAELTAPVLTGEETYQLFPQATIDNLVCCVGAPAPYAAQYNCGGSDLVYDAEQCTPTVGNGAYDLALTGTPALEGAGAEQVRYSLMLGGEVVQTSASPTFEFFGLGAPLCHTLKAVHLGTGAVVEGPELCSGDALAGKLGAQVIDPKTVLSCDLQTCAVGQNELGEPAWDLEQCTPLDPNDLPTTGVTDTATESEGSGDEAGQGGGDKGGACACTADPEPAPALLMFAGLIGLVRRRRR